MKKKFSHVIAHYLPQCLLLISLLTSNVLFPATVIAQEIENTNNVTQEETVPIDTSEDILEEGISTSVFEEKEVIIEEKVVESLFVFENGIYTVKNVIQDEEYVYPDNNDVRVKFTEVTQEGNLIIKRVELTQEQKELLNTKDNYGWDITSSMENGTFKYNLTLPNTQGNDDIEVKYTEDNNTYESIDNSNVEIKSNVVTIEGLDHFTMFVVVDDGDTDFSAPGWSSHPSGYQGDHMYVTSSQTDKTATWKYTGADISNGAVFLSWTIWDDHATNATYKSSLFSDVTVNQKRNAAQTATDTNGTWSGWYRVPSTGSLSIPKNSTVTLSPISGTDGNLSADAVAFVDLNAVPNEVWVNDNYSNNNSGEHFWGYNAFNKIQDGVNAVAKEGTVYVASGTYKENLTISKPITLKSLNESTFPIIDGSLDLSKAAISISADSVTVKGFTIQNASYPSAGNYPTGGIYLLNSKNSRIESNIFLNNGADISIDGGSNHIITGNTLNGSSSGDDDRWGIVVSSANDNEISNNTITGKSYSSLGAIYLEVSSNNIISGNLLTNNLTLGGILLVNASDHNRVLNNIIINNNNHLDNNGLISGVGIYLYESADNIISGNAVKKQNDGIRLEKSSNNFIEKNTVTENYNGINFISSSNSKAINFNNIYGNSAAGVFYDGTDTLDATNNWWGHITGPSAVGNGLGDKVSSNVTYQEWLCAPYQEGVTSVPSVSGVCTLTAPTLTGYNIKNSPTDPENIPRPTNEIACIGGYTNINSVSVHWTDVSGEDSNIKYQRQYKVNNGGWTGNEIYTNPYTGYRSFGGDTGNNGIYGSRVRAFYDTNRNGQYNEGEPVSGWSNECSITYDATPPLSPELISPEEPFYTRGVYFEQKWESIEDAVKYEYNSCYNDPDEEDGTCNLKYKETFTGKNNTTKIVSAGQPDSHFWWRVRAQDLAGNWSEWSEAWEVIIDNTPPRTPTATLTANGISVLTNGYTSSKTFIFNLSSSEDTTRYQLKYWNDISSSPYKESTPWNPTDLSGYSTGLGVYNDKFTQGEGKHYFSFSACDATNNCSEYSEPFVVTYDKTNPTVDLQFNVGHNNFKAVFSENVKEEDAKNPENYFLQNWPGAGGSGDLLGDADIIYEPSTHTATVTFTNSGWYISPEQQWGVQDIHDLAGNILAETPYTEYSTPMEPPKTSISGIDSNWHHSDVTVELTCTDINGSGCSKTFYSLDGGTTYQEGNTVIVSTEGENKITYYSIDNAGNEETSHTSDSIKIDKTAPVITLDTYNTDWTNQDITVKASTNEGTLNSDSHTFTENGSFDFIATDSAGNSTTKTVTITNIDKTKPTVDSISISNGLLTVTSTDLLSGVKSVEVQINSGEWITYTLGMNLYSLVDNTPGTTHTVNIRVTDNANNTTTSTTSFTIPTPEVLGATTGPSTTPTTKTNVSTYTLGIGSGKDTLEQGEEILETTSIEEPSVLGERCENKKKVSGYVYIDKNKDKEMNDNEEGIKDITLTIQYTDEEGNIKTEEEVNTDEKGYWETQLCSGKYNIVVKKDTLPKNIEVAEVLSLTVSDNEEETIFNIQALDTRNFWQKYWYLIVGGLAIIVIGYISIKNRKKEEI